MPLQATTPKKGSVGRLKAFMYGSYDVGKTTAAIDLFPNAVHIDTENGVVDDYVDALQENKSVLLQTDDYDTIWNELFALHTEEHDFTSVILDPITGLWDFIQEKWDEVFTRNALKNNNVKQLETGDFGFGCWGKKKRDNHRIMNLLKRIDMNVFVTAHEKDEWSSQGGGQPQKVGVTFDAEKKLGYFFSYGFRLYKNGGKRMVETVKQRSKKGEPKFPHIFEWNPEFVRETWGIEDLDRKAQVFEAARPEDIRKIDKLCKLLHIDEEQVATWHKRAGATDFTEYTQEQIEKTLKWLESRLPKNEEVA